MVEKKPVSKLFQSISEDWINNACINFSANPHGLYLLGYKEAAKFLTENASSKYKQDLFVYPIAFLYRHQLELHLKLIIHKGKILFDEGEGFPEHHELNKLWPLAKGVIRKLVTDKRDPLEFELIEHVVSEYTAIDSRSMAFRYPKDKEGNEYLNDITHINLTHLSKNMEAVWEFLDGVYMQILHYLDIKYEWERSYSFS